MTIKTEEGKLAVRLYDMIHTRAHGKLGSLTLSEIKLISALENFMEDESHKS